LEVLQRIAICSLTSSQKEFGYYKRVVGALKELSPSAKIFALVHKMDLVPPEQAKKVPHATISNTNEAVTSSNICIQKREKEKREMREECMYCVLVC
jgi:hypothetical protein